MMLKVTLAFPGGMLPGLAIFIGKTRGVGVEVGNGVLVLVGVNVAKDVLVAVGVLLGVAVRVGVLVLVGVNVIVGVGDGEGVGDGSQSWPSRKQKSEGSGRRSGAPGISATIAGRTAPSI
jgi:hypothetical protein